VRFAVASFKPHQAHIARQMVAACRLPIEVYVGKTAELIRLSDCCMAVSAMPRSLPPAGFGPSGPSACALSEFPGCVFDGGAFGRGASPAWSGPFVECGVSAFDGFVGGFGGGVFGLCEEVPSSWFEGGGFFDGVGPWSSPCGLV